MKPKWLRDLNAPGRPWFIAIEAVIIGAFAVLVLVAYAAKPW